MELQTWVTGNTELHKASALQESREFQIYTIIKYLEIQEDKSGKHYNHFYSADKRN